MTKKVARTFKKTKIQVEAVKLLSGPATETMLFGGSRSGKTAILIYAIFVRALKTKSRHLIVRKNFNHAKRSLWLDTIPKILKLAFPELNRSAMENKTDFFYTLPNGSEVWVGGLDDADRVEKILGNEYSTIYFNESSQLDYNSVAIAKTRLAEKSLLVNKIYADMNPPNKRHWSYKQFILHINPKTRKPLKKSRYTSMRMNPVDNMENIDAGYLEILDEMTEKQKARFKYGKFSDDDDGLLFKESYIQRFYEIMDFDRIVVSIDPAASSGENSNETGIVVVARKGDFGYVLEDCSGKYKPSDWAKVAVDLYDKWAADKIIGEVNNGGDMIESVIRNYDINVSYDKVRATRGKVKRAEPIAALYEKEKIFHYGMIEKLEEQMVEFETVEKDGVESPDRVDAMVWGFSYIFDITANQFNMMVL